jgi:4-hydroxythreonine-4-phosphate dehydrogenase
MKKTAKKPVIAITMGDPAGIGPEIVLRALNEKRVMEKAEPVVIGDTGLLRLISKRLGLPMPFKGDGFISGPCLDLKRLGPGQPTPESSRAMVGYIETAVNMANAGLADAIVTCPISKDSARLAGFGYPGHTEFIARLTRAKDFRMMLGGERLKVVLATIHEPLKRVPGLLTKKGVFDTIRIADDSFKRWFGMKRPRVAVAGLNPHAGEGGLFGREEKDIIAPAVKKARAAGIDAKGPYPPDTLFHRAVNKGEFDCVVCMYHDQGLIPLKLLHFEDGVNVTLGLPIIRTSVDHGTAYDIAWKGVASPLSLISAIETAVGMARFK